MTMMLADVHLTLARGVRVPVCAYNIVFRQVACSFLNDHHLKSLFLTIFFLTEKSLQLQNVEIDWI